MTGSELIAKERQRQVSVEDWTPKHDEQHTNGELGKAAINYIRFAVECEVGRNYQRRHGHTPNGWPWHYVWWKPSLDNSEECRIRELTKAGALIAAEIDRLNRRTP
jgi:hypothetical protein